MKKACIFDLDGTLINSLEDLAASSNHALEALGFPTHPVDRYRFFVGRGVAKLIEAIIPEANRTPETLKQARALFDAHYGAHYLDKTAPYEGVPELLQQLGAQGFALAVVSNKPDVFVKKIVGRVFGSRFDAVIGQREGVPRKPDPAAVFEACSRIEVSPGDCFYLGDSGVDMQTARAAGAFAVGVTWGFRGREELMENGAQALIDRPDGLLPLTAARTDAGIPSSPRKD